MKESLIRNLISMNDIWIEKYRPSSISEIVNHDEIKSQLKNYIKTRSLPHLLFAGPAGTGKTTCAIVLAKELYSENWLSYFHELNASDERGIDVVRIKIKDYARTTSISSKDFKIIFLDEADALTPDAQAALRRTMEKFSSNCRFILSCNYSSKIIEPIQSRCALLRFRPLKKEDVVQHLRKIATNEARKVSDEALGAIAYIAAGDLRKAINILQSACAVIEKSVTISNDDIYKIAGVAHPEEIIKMMTLSINGNFLGAREQLDKLMIESGLSGDEIIKEMHRVATSSLSINDDLRVLLIDRIGEAEFRIVEGSNPRIQIEALLAFLSHISKK